MVGVDYQGHGKGTELLPVRWWWFGRVCIRVVCAGEMVVVCRCLWPFLKVVGAVMCPSRLVGFGASNNRLR